MRSGASKEVRLPSELGSRIMPGDMYFQSGLDMNMALQGQPLHQYTPNTGPMQP